MLNDKILKVFQNKNALITGGTGLLGRQVTDILCMSGAYVRCISLDKVTLHAQAEYIYGDLTDFAFCKNVMKGMDFVFHIAGVKGSASVSLSQPASHFVPTLMMNTNVLEASRINKVDRLVYTSSIGAYANADIFRETDYRLDTMPMDFAGWSKRMAELQIHAYREQYGIENFAVVRPCNVYGPGDNFDPENAMVIPSLMHRIFNNESPLTVWGDGSAIRDIAFSRDVAEGIILALCHGTRGGFVNLGSGTGVSIREIVDTLQSFLDFEYVFDPSKPTGYPKRVMDITLAKQELGYAPATSLADGLKATWDWYIANQHEYQLKQNYFTQSQS